MATEYHRLGNYIREVNVRNRELKVTEPMGINIDKHFMPSVANVIGTDLSTYKLVFKNQFACNLMHVGRDEKIPIAMQTDDNPIIVSPAYFVFEVTKTGVLLPNYLMMWFCRKEFDRNAWFYTDADVRGGLDKEALMDMQLPVPSIERQREIVSEYETLTRRIRLNEQMIEKLEATAQALYRHTFVDNIDKQNLPQGWRIGSLSELADITMGQSPDGETYNMEGEGIIFYQGRADFGNRFPTPRVYTTDPTRYAKEGDILLSVRAPVGDINIAPHDCCIGRGLASLRSKNHCQSYLFYQMLELEQVFTISDVDGTVFGSINKDDLYNIGVVIPNIQGMSMFEKQAFVIDKEIKLKDKEINILTELLSLLLAKIGK
ncbi:MAG: restriction endonuclease subunit S [Bacteroidales bacterium]|nr:restriction endonuclease subunit S [Bacteroidales bacterium]